VIPMATESDKDTEQVLKASGLSYTYVRNTVYADTLGFLLGPDVLNSGVTFPSGEGRIAYATKADLGEGLASLVINGGFENQEITLSNTESWSSGDIAELLSQISGKKVPFLNSTRSEYVSHMEGTGLPFIYADFAADWAEAKKEGEFAETGKSLENLLGRKPTTLIDYLKTAYQSKN